MNDTLTLNKLEKLIEMETQIRAEYQPQLEEKEAAISPPLMLKRGYI